MLFAFDTAHLHPIARAPSPRASNYQRQFRSQSPARASPPQETARASTGAVRVSEWAAAFLCESPVVAAERLELVQPSAQRPVQRSAQAHCTSPLSARWAHLQDAPSEYPPSAPAASPLRAASAP